MPGFATGRSESSSQDLLTISTGGRRGRSSDSLPVSIRSLYQEISNMMSIFNTKQIFWNSRNLSLQVSKQTTHLRGMGQTQKFHNFLNCSLLPAARGMNSSVSQTPIVCKIDVNRASEHSSRAAYTIS